MEWRRVEDPNWRNRENGRILSGAYVRLPKSWRNQENHHHDRYPHISIENPGLIAFTENEEKGKLDIQARMKPGRYIQKFHPELSMEMTRQLCADFEALIGKDGLKITKNPAEIVTIYENGPSSCMSKTGCWVFDCVQIGYTNPAFVYGLGDLAVAYVGDVDSARARCVVWPDKKLYGRIYGHSDLMVPLLNEAGYADGYIGISAYNSPFIGAKIKAVFADKKQTRIVMPYVDMAYWAKATPDDEYVELVGSRYDPNAFCVQETSGVCVYLTSRPRCYVSNRIINDTDETIFLDGQNVAILQEAIEGGYVLTMDGVWTRYAIYINNIAYSTEYVLANPDVFAEDIITGTYYNVGDTETCYYYTNLADRRWQNRKRIVRRPIKDLRAVNQFIVERDGNFYENDSSEVYPWSRNDRLSGSPLRSEITLSPRDQFYDLTEVV